MGIQKRTIKQPLSIEDRAAIEIQKAEGAIDTGDVVRLNSGGPNMLVMGVFDKKATCCWVADPVQHVNMLAFGRFDLMTIYIIAKNSAE